MRRASRTLHAPEHFVVDVLNGNVKIAQHFFVRKEPVDKGLVHLRRVQIQQPEPDVVRNRGFQSPEKIEQPRFPVKIPAVRGQILSDETQFARPFPDERLRLRDDRRDRNAPGASANRRDGAIRAHVVAPFAHLEIPRPAPRFRQHSPRRGARVAPERAKHRGPVLRFRPDIDAGDFLFQILAVAVVQAPEDADSPKASLLLELFQIQNRSNTLFHGRLNEAARVHEGDIRVFGVFDKRMPRGFQHSGEDLAVGRVLGAPEAQEKDLHSVAFPVFPSGS